VNPAPGIEFRLFSLLILRWRMHFDLKKVAEFIRRADTEELLDRVTVYREGMEPAALDLMEGELDRRGVTREDIADHDADRRATAIMLPDGTALRCSFCDRPAVVRGRGWHKLFGRVPVFPRLFAYCATHARGKTRHNANPPGEEEN
jgi:hypothetical protein